MAVKQNTALIAPARLAFDLELQLNWYDPNPALAKLPDYIVALAIQEIAR